MTNIALVVLGFILLIKGADWLVSGSSSLARKLGISGLLVGLTVVAFGTSMPELVVNIFAAIRDTGDIAIGNILGSNIANIALVLGFAAALYPLRVQSSTIWKEIPYSLLAVVLVYIMASDTLLDGADIDMIGRGDGLVLVAFTVIFMYYVFGLAKGGRSQAEVEVEKMSKWKMAWLIVAGILMLVFGGRFVIDGAVGLAEGFGMSQKLIGLTVVALGTSLPELVTSIVAALKKQVDISVGNIVGSNILNIFWVLGISATLRPIPFSPGTIIDELVTIFFTFMLFFFMFIGKKHELERWQGIGFVVLYFLYIGFSFMAG